MDTQGVNGSLKVGQQHAATIKLFHRLNAAAIGETITYAELNSLINANIQSAARGYLNTARNQLRREHGYVFITIVGVGLRRVDDNGKVDVTTKQLQKTRMAGRRASKTAETVTLANLSADQAHKHLTNITIAGILDHATKPHQMHQITQQVINRKAYLPPLPAMEVFKNS